MAEANNLKYAYCGIRTLDCMQVIQVCLLLEHEGFCLNIQIHILNGGINNAETVMQYVRVNFFYTAKYWLHADQFTQKKIGIYTCPLAAVRRKTVIDCLFFIFSN